MIIWTFPIPAHGGSDPGAVSGDTREKDLTLAISNYMYERFKELGVPVALTRPTDETLNSTNRVNRVLNAFGNSSDVVVISNHINSNTTGTAEGAEVIYALRNDATLAQNILNALGDAGQKKRTIFQRRLPSNSNLDYYFMHRETGKTEPVIVEYGFINNANDQAKLKNNYKRYVDAVVDAVIATKMGGSIPAQGTSKTYTVKNGDSLYKIANANNTTVNAIKSLNNLTSDMLSVGQILQIPSAATTTTSTGGNTYTVQNGDSLWKIAQKFNTSVDAIKSTNGLSSNNLIIGQKLAIPSSQTTTPTTFGSGKYIVKSGDTLWKIANANNTSVNEIKRLNNLTSDALSVGQTLILPSSSENNTNYVVQNGDSLWKIANKFGISVDSLKSLNGLTSNMITIGQNLKIPNN